MLRRQTLVIGLAFFLFCVESLQAQETRTLYLSGKGKDDPVQWEFYCTEGRNSGRWTTIGVPSNWELQGFGTYNYGHDRNKGAEQGKYRRRFELPESFKDKVIYIVFEGVMTDTQVWVNGSTAGPKHQGGFYRFKYDITEFVKFGAENLLEVTASKVSSDKSVEAAERQSDYWVFGGIYRPVYLQAFPMQFIERTAIDARADGTISVDVYLNGITTADVITGTVLDPTIGSVGVLSVNLSPDQEKATLKGKVAGIKAWTAETPHLYNLEMSLKAGNEIVHKTTERFGFRTFEVRPGDGLYLNGQKIRLKGVNRHCFWPDSGRCLSRKISYDDVRLIKQMNMNAVRMSHYPPDVHFLEACDELGLYVLDELAGWQRPPYDTGIGKKLVKEVVTRDISHPCILFWDNGNEGGWNRELDGEFALYDPQKRTVLHPWENFNGIDTDHYENYQSTQKKLSSTLFMPTEFLHGLYDGGLGAGLDDWWNLMLDSPLGAGGFLWALVDEGVVRMDKNGIIDTDGNHAPDGILGPYRQKEGSFYTVKEIWSPVYIDLQKLPDDFSGRIEVENRYNFTDLQDIRFDWKLAQFPKPCENKAEHTVLSAGEVSCPSVKPGGKGALELELPESRQKANVLYITASNKTGSDIWTWSWETQQKDCAQCHQYISQETKKDANIEVIEKEAALLVKIDSLNLSFDKKTGELAKVEKNGNQISFDKGPRLITGQSTLTDLKHWREQDNILIEAKYEDGLNYVQWKIYPSGWIRLEYEYELEGQFNLMGVAFDYPEDKMQKMKWVGRGPYRVWKNRTKGGLLDVWSNDYKDHTPGLTWDFPEFRGYYTDWHWAVFETQEGKITLLNGTKDIFLGVYRPKNGSDPRSTGLDLPETGISLLHGIPAIGTKFTRASEHGPQSRQNQASGKYKAVVCLYFETDGK
jgi:hypothetical protein